jgi:hypothetical protein
MENSPLQNVSSKLLTNNVVSTSRQGLQTTAEPGKLHWYSPRKVAVKDPKMRQLEEASQVRWKRTNKGIIFRETSIPIHSNAMHPSYQAPMVIHQSRYLIPNPVAISLGCLVLSGTFRGLSLAPCSWHDDTVDSSPCFEF